MRVCVTKSIYSEDEDFDGADAVFDCIGEGWFCFQTPCFQLLATHTVCSMNNLSAHRIILWFQTPF
jgi:hypothetical protein